MNTEYALSNGTKANKPADPRMRFNVRKVNGEFVVEFDPENGKYHYDEMPLHLNQAARVAFSQATGYPIEKLSAHSTK